MYYAGPLPTACRQEITKKGRIDRPRRVHYALLYARTLYAILFVVSRRLDEHVFFSLFFPFPPPFSLSLPDLPLARSLSLCVISTPMTEEKWKATGRNTEEG